jgi:hypothetical protein
VRQEVESYYAASGQAIPTTIADMVTLEQNLASIVTPLYEDVERTFGNSRTAGLHRPEPGLQT